jgi:hypothetical protein
MATRAVAGDGRTDKALGPWREMRGVAIGAAVACAVIWAIRKGLQDRERYEPDLKDVKAKWALYHQIENIEKNSFDMRDSLTAIAKAQEGIQDNVGRLVSVPWNRSQGI